MMILCRERAIDAILYTQIFAIQINNEVHIKQSVVVEILEFNSSKNTYFVIY